VTEKKLLTLEKDFARTFVRAERCDLEHELDHVPARDSS
jgi:hypothetical protein